MAETIRKFFNKEDEEVGPSAAEYAIELEFSKEKQLLRSKHFEVVRTEFVEKKQTKAKATKAVVTVLERVEAGSGLFRYVVGVPFGSEAKAKREEGEEGHWVTIRGNPVFIRGPRRVQVGITSYTEEGAGSLAKLQDDISELDRDLGATGVGNLSVELGTGGWEGGSEPTFVTQFEGDGEARKVLAEKAKKWNQQAVIVMQHVEKGGQPQTRISFGDSLTKEEYRIIEAGLLDSSRRYEAGIGGWTWGRDEKSGHPVLIVQCIPQWGGNPDQHMAATQELTRKLGKNGYKVSHTELRTEVEVWEKEAGDYERILGGKAS